MKEIKYRLSAFLNPLQIRPSFLLPIFSYKNDFFVQESVDDKIINNFRKIQKDELEDLIYLKSIKIQRCVGDAVIDGFIFSKNDYCIGQIASISGKLRNRLTELKAYPFIYLEVLNYLDELDNDPNAFYRLRNTLYHSNERIADKIVNRELDRKEINSSNLGYFDLKYSDESGCINYWDMFPQIFDLILEYNQVYIKLQLIRSKIGASKKLKNKIDSFGFRYSKLGSESPLILVNKYNFKNLKAINTHTVIISVSWFADKDYLIEANDVTSIMRRYKKRNPKKNVKSKIHKDYVVKFQEIQKEMK